ncbi:hypothetical protein SAMN05421579_103141 [Xenorhabdus japonica]|uniref:Uncharacterized protein n=1 Tax=Xenorhabdus japonica TaxID=53341 RepID=A0A1I4YYI4_9GAMM|nr:hypothetical protein SAMN05421579_103141 [Xenorhabdus japonica]
MLNVAIHNYLQVAGKEFGRKVHHDIDSGIS